MFCGWFDTTRGILNEWRFLSDRCGTSTKLHPEKEFVYSLWRTSCCAVHISSLISHVKAYFLFSYDGPGFLTHDDPYFRSEPQLYHDNVGAQWAPKQKSINVVEIWTQQARQSYHTHRRRDTLKQTESAQGTTRRKTHYTIFYKKTKKTRQKIWSYLPKQNTQMPSRNILSQPKRRPPTRRGWIPTLQSMHISII